MRAHGFEPIQVKSGLIPYTQNFKYPVIEGFFKKGKKSSWKADRKSKKAATAYILYSSKEKKKLDKKLKAFAKCQAPLLVWGVGTNTQSMLVSSPLKYANIIAFTDSNPHYHNKKIMGRLVIHPQSLKDHSYPILIASFIFRKEIAFQIKRILRCKNKIINLR